MAAGTDICQAGFRVLTATDPNDALRLCEDHPDKIDLMVTDVVMPQMSGRALADRALALRGDLRVLYMSGYTNDIVLDHGVREGISFLQKPISVDALLRRVHALLDEAIQNAA
ncbi:MAG: multi-sensor hybrid histidine kinase [Myxococcaceae bacterium]|nr:multi-sensor hybrid histidine kinase [Myxococcaceae bacterium]MEA2753178.1 hypothetical protein [Myxococcales bacterium]